MARPEAKIEEAFVKYAKSKGCKPLKLRIDGENGFPDRTILLPNGRVLFIEFKAESGIESKLQEAWRATLRAMGFSAHLCFELDYAKMLLDDML